MLERQHTQLIAGLQELYRRTQYGQGGNGPRSEPINYGQPLTHNILEGLGVLQQDEWDDSEGPDGSRWQNFEQHANDLASSYLCSLHRRRRKLHFRQYQPRKGPSPILPAWRSTN